MKAGLLPKSPLARQPNRDVKPLAVNTAIDTLLFDLDGTLVDMRRRGIELRFMLRALRRFAPILSPFTFRRAFWQAVETMRHHDSTQTNHAVLVDSLARQANCPPQVVDELIRRFVAEDFAALQHHFVPVPEARETLDLARKLGYRIFLATNPVVPRATVKMRLAWAGLADVQFAGITHSELMTRSKPNPAYYHELLETFHLTADQCLMVGNDPLKDLPATSANIMTYLLGSTLPPHQHRPANPRMYGLGDFSHLQHWLRRGAAETAQCP